jgi:hypothetical protein
MDVNLGRLKGDDRQCMQKVFVEALGAGFGTSCFRVEKGTGRVLKNTSNPLWVNELLNSISQQLSIMDQPRVRRDFRSAVQPS